MFLSERNSFCAPLVGGVPLAPTADSTSWDRVRLTGILVMKEEPYVGDGAFRGSPFSFAVPDGTPNFSGVSFTTFSVVCVNSRGFGRFKCRDCGVTFRSTVVNGRRLDRISPAAIGFPVVASLGLFSIGERSVCFGGRLAFCHELFIAREIWDHAIHLTENEYFFHSGESVASFVHNGITNHSKSSSHAAH